MPERPEYPGIQRLGHDGVAVHWAERDVPPELTLVFRAGRVDEELRESGACHLIEHLVLESLGSKPYEMNGFSAGTHTAFTAAGTPAELASFVHEVSSALAALPTDRLDVERRVLHAESADRGAATAAVMWMRRYGAGALGRVALPEAALTAMSADELVRWARTHFTRSAAAVCWTGPEPPPELTLPLPDGPLHAYAPPEPVVPLPFARQDETNCITLSLALSRDVAPLVAVEVLRERLEQRLRQELGLVYEVELVTETPTLDLRHAAIFIVPPESALGTARAAVIAELDDRWDDAGKQLERVRRALLADFDERERMGGSLVSRALAEFEGRSWPSAEATRRALEQVDLAAVVAARDGARATALLVSPDELPHPGAPFADSAALHDSPPVTGTTYTTRELRASQRDALIVGEAGFTLLVPGWPASTVHWAEIAGATRELGGSWVMTLRDATTTMITPSTFRDARGVEAALDAGIPAGAWIPPFGAEHADAITAHADRDLAPRHAKRVKQELDRLPGELDPGEMVRGIAVAMRGVRLGLLAVTERRTIFLFLDAEPHITLHHAVSGVRFRERAREFTLETADGAVKFTVVGGAEAFRKVRTLVLEVTGPRAPLDPPHRQPTHH